MSEESVVALRCRRLAAVVAASLDDVTHILSRADGARHLAVSQHLVVRLKHTLWI